MISLMLLAAGTFSMMDVQPAIEKHYQEALAIDVTCATTEPVMSLKEDKARLLTIQGLRYNNRQNDAGTLYRIRQIEQVALPMLVETQFHLANGFLKKGCLDQADELFRDALIRWPPLRLKSISQWHPYGRSISVARAASSRWIAFPRGLLRPAPGGRPAASPARSGEHQRHRRSPPRPARVHRDR